MESPSPESIFLEDFGQKVDLTRRIREVLLNYPEGTTVLKELIQNADDAGATVVRLCLDRRLHGSDSLLSETLAPWQGPSLLAYNDAVFTEEDFVSISRIGGSSKHGQASKTGRFGVGFNSVYHLTDLPSFVSGKYVVLFDPQGIFLPKVSASNPGKRIDYVSSSAISVYRDQFFPYCAFGCDMKTPFSGTLFRFPLRNAEQAATSKLSRQEYSEDDLSSLLLQLYEEGVFTLLFLKSVLRIEMYVWDAQDSEPRKLYSCSVSSASDDIVRHRQAVLRFPKSVNSTESQVDCYSVDFVREAMIGTQSQKKTDRFYLVQALASTSSRIGKFAATASKEYDMHLLPWASVAACITDNSEQNDALRLGQAFCFLPLPVRTGLSVQVNGYFEVSSNRRGIWYGADMDRSGKIRSVWNRLLLEEVVAPAFTQLLLGIRGLLDSRKLYYSLWPSGSFEEPWNILVQHIYRNISNAPVLYSELEVGKWVAPVEAFLHDQEVTKSKELGEALIELGMPIVGLPNNLFDMLLKYASTYRQKVVTPDTVRCFLRECRFLSTFGKAYKLVLLEYCLEDLLDADVGTHAYNLPLLPLANGEFGLLSEASKGISYFICSDLEFRLLQQIYDRIVDRDIPINLLHRLSAIAKSSKANLVIFNVQYFLQFYPRFVPADWQYKSKVLWDPESCHNQPTSSWFVLFWQYLRSQCDKLSIFSDWPILPSTSGHLYRASRESKLMNAEKLSDKVQGVLVKIGCKILNPNYGVEHSDLFHYVSDGNATGLVESIFDVVSLNCGTIATCFHSLEAEERDELRSFLLDPKWYFGACLNESAIRNCKRLPIYKVYGGGSTQSFQFSDLESPRKYLPPLDIPECFLGAEFLISSDTELQILLSYYGIERMGKALFYKQQVLNRVGELQPEVRNNIVLSILQNLPQLCVEDTSFREYLRNLEFLPTLSGALRCPTALYDPRNEELYALLDDSDSFPYGPFQEPGVLDMLQGLGLRTSVTPETVIQSARQVEQLMHEDQQKAHLKGKVLLSYLEVNAMKWIPNLLNGDQGTVNRMFSRAATAFRPRNLKSDLEKFWNDLRLVSWCPVLVSAPFPTLPWPVVSSTVAPPKLVRLQADMWLVSASMRILDGECSSTALSSSLGWSSPPGGSVIAAQLLELGKNNEIVNDQVLRQELAVAMPRIYSILAGLIGSDEMDIVKAVLEGSRWIWVGDGFATVDEVVLNGPIHLAPYIRVIPVDLAVFKELFLELGIREFLKPTDYANILCRMALKKGSSPLDAQEIRAALLIVQHLAEVQIHDQKVKIYLPDVSGRLYPAGDLVYNDAPWLLGSEDHDSPFGGSSNMPLNARRTVQKFVHGNISIDVAEKLGVCSLRRILLAESADSMNLSLSGAAEAFGQHEALTTRLKHILEMYADGPGILFELVQNAEDAGASEVNFLLDKTQYGTSSVLSPEMADWQGPALYCFNDSVFSPQDLYAISRIGQESKLEKPFAIGRFGLGFNCVYHFTDIPTFVSGENIVMFDPHACNLPGISPSHPGLRIKFSGRKIMEQFPDQFSPFLHFGCDLQHPFPGTLFRFPLRSASAASRSQIKKEGYAPEDVMSLFSSFAKVVSETLLFLRNVKVISVFVKEGSGHEMQLLHRVNKHCNSEPEMESNARQDVFSLFYGNRHNGMDKEQFLKKLRKSADKDLPYKCQKVIITEESSSGNVSHSWITSECIGGGQAKKKFPVFSDKSHTYFPWACVAAYLYSSKVGLQTSDISENNETCAVTSNLFQVPPGPSEDRKDLEGRAFCFLPLPITTGLPAHVNAYFELSSNRRDIWFGNDMAGGGKKRSDWNMYLLEGVVAPAYGHMLEKIAPEIGPCELFFSLWPKTRGLEPWALVVRELYMFIADCGLRVLYTKAREGQWISTKQAIFPDFTFDKVDELIEALSDAGLPLVTVSKPIVERFMDVCPALHFLTPELLKTLLIRRKREFKDRNTMVLALEYCLLDLKMPVQSAGLYGLYGLPLLPLADGSFTIIDKKGIGERIYIARGDEYDLLKDSVPNLLVDCTIPGGVYEKLCYIAQSEASNISLLSCRLLEKLFLRILPAEWHHAKQVTWAPGQQGQPSVEWVRLLWSYLRSSCDDLSLFSKWPILPVGNNCLLQLVDNSNIIKDDGWSEKMSALLLKIGCVFLRHDLAVDHPQLKRFVQLPTAIGLLNAFLAVAGKPENIEGLFNDATEGEMHELRSFILQSKWFIEEKMEDTHIDIMKHLPMFESYKSRKFVSLSNPVKLLKPGDIHEDFLSDDFVRTESEKEKIILRRYLEIEEPSRMEFYRDHLLNRMSKFLSEQGSLTAILHGVQVLVEEDNSLKSAISEIPFVLAADGSWQKPSRLYDPRVTALRKVLHGEVFFPSDKFSDTETLDILNTLGLRKTLGYSGLIDCARSVSLLHFSRDSETLSYGRKLLVCLDALSCKLSTEEEGNLDESTNSVFQNDTRTEDGDVMYIESPKSNENIKIDDLEINSFVDNLIDDKPEEDFWSEMRAIAWCPVCVDPPLKGIPWLKSSNQVASPSNVRPKSQMFMVSYSMHILDGVCRSTYLQKKLGWMDPPNINVLSTQLIELPKLYFQLKSHSTDIQDVDAALCEGIPSLYSKLQEYIGTDEFSDLELALHGVSWVWIGDNFVVPNALAFDSPVKFSPYLYVVPSELSEFRDLLIKLGVRISFDIWDYLHVLQRLQNDVKGFPLSTDQLNFAHCVLDAVADCCSEKPPFEASNTPMLIPDFSGVLMDAGDLVYNDAPWMEHSTLVGKHFVHPTISNDLANRLGVQSLRSLSLVDDEMTKDIPCMDYARIKELLASYGDNDLLLFDLLELADCCKANKLHLIFDKREHPRQSLLQHNMGEFQGPALLAILEGANLSREEVSSLQFLPPWRLRGATVNYGLALLSCYFVCDLLSVVSGGYFYMFDPRGSVLAAPSSCTPAAKMFSLTGTNLTDRFRDQFNPMLIGHSMPWPSSDSTIIRMPLSSECLINELEFGLRKIKQITERFLEHSSRSLLFLKSVMQVSICTWEEGSAQPCQDYSVSIDSSSAIMRNPFSEKKWRKFQISRLFNSSNAATKLQVIDVNLNQGKARVVDRWLVALSLGSGQTRNMALDRRYLAYNLTPVAGVAAHISRDGYPVDVCLTSSIMSPLPLSGGINIPVTVLGCFLVCHNGGRSLFNYQDKEASSAEARVDAGNLLMEAWNKELMSCVRDSYIELILEIQRLRIDPSSSATESSAGLAVSLSLKGYGDQIYSFWPRSNRHNLAKQPGDGSIPSIEVPKSDWECVIEQVISPFYARIVDLPVWQLYSGNFAKAEEGMFLSQPGHGVGGNLLPATVCSFVKEHYPVFSVPWELVTEIQALGITVREVKPKMVRNLLRASSSSIVLRSIDMYADVLEYCLSDIEIGDSFNSAGNSLTVDNSNTRGDSQVVGGSSASQSVTSLHTYPASSTQNATSSGDAIEMVTSLGKALLDFGRGVVEDIGRSGGPLVQRNMVAGSSNSIYGNGDMNLLSIAAELKGLPCPTAANRLTKLGFTELWVGNSEQQALMVSLAEKFVHPKVLDRSILADIFSNVVLQSLLKLRSFSLHLLASHMKFVFQDNWASYVMGSNMVPWFSWENNKSSSGGEGGPSPEWIRLFWKNFNGSSEDLLLFYDWPLIPAFLGRPILCRVRERDLVFIPPLLIDPTSEENALETSATGSNHMPESESIQAYISAFEVAKNQHPWLLSLLNHCNIPIFDIGFLHCAAPSNCFPPPDQSLGQVIASKLVAAKNAGYFSEVTSLSASNCDALFALFANDFLSNGSNYRREELEVLSSLPIYKTVVGSYTQLISDDLCMISTNSFLKPYDERCLSYTTDSVEFSLLRALGVPELHDQQILIRFGLPGFEGKPEPEKEDILIYLYTNWQDLQMDTAVVEALKETKFVRNADEFCTDLYKPKDLFDPGDALLTSVFSGERKKFPGERFFADRWLRILRKTGLRTAIESDVILECAKRVEFLGSECMRSRDLDDFDDLTNSQSEVSMEVWTLAGSVVEAIFSNFAVLYGNNFCDLLGKIKCIPAEFGFPNVAGKKGGKRVFTSYSEAILLRDWPLAWSCAPILSRQNVVPPDYSWGSLQLRSPPAFPTVIKHLQIIGRNGGEDTLAHWPTVSGMMTVDEASCEVLKYLDKIWNSLSSSDIMDLQRVPFIPAANGTRLVTANLLFARLTINLSPFAFELPTSYLPFLKILKDLGLQDMLSIASARDLLLNLQKTCGYQRLNPNELRAVLEILYFICEGVTADDMSNGPNWTSAAIVPDDSCRLVHAKSCVYIDSHGSRFVKCIDPSRLRFIHPDLPERFCTVLGIKKLSDVVIEELDHEEHVETLDHIGSVPIVAIREKLLSKSLQSAVWTVVNSMASYIPAIKHLTVETIQNLLESVAEKLQFVKCLHTRFLLLPHSVDITHAAKDSIIPEWVNGSMHQTLYFINRTNTCILVSEPPPYISVFDVIAIVVSLVLGSPTPLPIGSLFVCPGGSETAIVDLLKLCSDKQEMEATSGSNGLVGKELLPQDVHQVQFHPLRPFYAGEIVAWRSQNGEKLKYGRVPEDVRPSAGQALYRFKVETSLGFMQPLLSSHVFSFKGVAMGSETLPVSMDDVRTMDHSRTRIDMPETSGSGKSRASQPQAGKDLQYGRVSPAELVQAVQEMLSAAGIYMDVEKQSLLQKTLTLQEQLKESQTSLLLEQEKADVAAKEADTAKAAWVCRVCLSSEVDITIVPCGHVLCRRCSSAVSRCPFCRLQVSKTVRIFRP
ncbi:putative transcription factor C2H2 family [Rosa chinensis]|uniref:Putative transcription factor C2H2 family n=1 Tax=Rosa chinensis TaxID=74649 RepID=A0A2P6R4R3_ROSCH|nr:sacsin isoform X2 [Rosa chinensis]PRQ41414.1 putative transcription factor C2H2 family [Rosa chinensis]